MNDNLNPNMMNNGMPPVPQQTTKKTGLTISILIIILLLILAAIYMFSNREVADTEVNTNTEDAAVIRNESAVMDPEDAQIEADLDAQLKDVDYSF